ncbi:hypothetical protein SLA2020_062370 [Shorea laevis]
MVGEGKSKSNSTVSNDLFSSVISDIKSYAGKDPLLPWLRGIRKLKEALPPHVLNEKLPRFLQKCTQSFQSDRRYRNDLRYLRVWLQLMDFVDDPKVLLRTMEVNHIGTKRSLFYQAYALYYEKMKKYGEAEKMYHLGVQNLAEPLDELQKSYDQFLNRMERHNNKKIQESKTARRPLSAMSIPTQTSETRENNEKMARVEDSIPSLKKEIVEMVGSRSTSKKQVVMDRKSDEPRMVGNEDTVVVKFVDTAIDSKSQAEDACHHGLVDPTINLKEAMNAINSMFREPLEIAPAGRKSHRRQQKEDHSLNTGFKVFVDDTLNGGVNSSVQNEEKVQPNRAQTSQPQGEPFEIFLDDDESNEIGDGDDKKDYFEEPEVQDSAEGPISPALRLNAFVFPTPKDFPSESSSEVTAERFPGTKLREDTVVHRFVGSTISDEPEVENVCHHGLVDPTINLKEAMEDINSMFGKPIDFVRAKRSKKQEKAPLPKQDLGAFSILPDDELEPPRQLPRKSSSTKLNDQDLFEPTVFTKAAMDDINKMFGMPLDF